MKTHVSSCRRSSALLTVFTFLAACAAIAQDPTVTIHATDPQAAEAFNDTGTFTVRRTGGTNFSLLVFYQLSGSASNGVDYEQLGNTVQIPAGALAASFTVKPIDDSFVEGTENVLAQLVASPMMCMTCGYAIGTPSLAEVLIYDNDRTGTNHPPFVQLNSPQDGDVFTASSDITLRAYAQDAEDRFLVKVEFYADGNSLGFGTFEPTLCPSPFCPSFALTWSNVPPGQYTLTAVATDSNGASSVSHPADITVFEGVNIFAADPLATERLAISTLELDNARFTVRRAADDTNAAIKVQYQISGTASNGVDYQKLSGEVTIPAGASSADIVVTPIDDNLPEDTETVVLTLIPPCPQCLFANPPCLPPVPIDGSCYPLGPHKQAIAYIRDNDPSTNRPEVNIYATDNTGSEIPEVPPWLGTPTTQGIPQRVDPAIFTVTRTGPTNSPLTVFYSVGGTASNAVDYVRLPGSVSIPAGASSAQIEVWVIDDFEVEGTETVELRVLPPVCIQIFPPPPECYLVGPSNRAVAYILDNDPRSTPVVTIVAADPDASESGPDTGRFTVSRTGETNYALAVYLTITGTAQNGVDYLTLSNLVVIPTGASSADIIVTPIDDRLAEGAETVRVQLRYSIWPDDFGGPTAPAFAWNSEPAYVLGVPSNAVVTIADNDPPTTNHPPSVELITPRNGEVFDASADIRLVAFAQDAEDHYTLKVEFFEDGHSLGLGTVFWGRCAVCPNYQLTWSNVPPGQYTLTAVATDSAGASSLSDPVRITVSESNRPPVVDIVARDPFASEGTNFWHTWSAATSDAWHVNPGGTNTATFVVRRHGPTNTALTVAYEIGGTASNGIDYSALSGSVTIPAGRHSAQIIVWPIDDSLAEGIETVLLKLQPSSDYIAGTPSHAAAIIIDNDQPRPPCIRLPDRCFHVCRPATDGFCYRVEASTDLQNWTAVCINVVTDGALQFVDPDAPPFNSRFYRIKPEPALLPDD